MEIKQASPDELVRMVTAAFNLIASGSLYAEERERVWGIIQSATTPVVVYSQIDGVGRASRQ